MVALGPHNISCEDGICRTWLPASLHAGEEYSVIVKCYNIANDFTVRQSGVLKVIVDEKQRLAVILTIAIIATLLFMACSAGLTVAIW